MYLPDIDGAREVRLTTGPAQDRFPVWSPDRKRIAYGSQRDGEWELWVTNADGSDATRLTRDIVAKSPRSWSPDGSKIAFVAEHDGR